MMCGFGEGQQQQHQNIVSVQYLQYIKTERHKEKIWYVLLYMISRAVDIKRRQLLVVLKRRRAATTATASVAVPSNSISLSRLSSSSTTTATVTLSVKPSTQFRQVQQATTNNLQSTNTDTTYTNKTTTVTASVMTEQQNVSVALPGGSDGVSRGKGRKPSRGKGRGNIGRGRGRSKEGRGLPSASSSPFTSKSAGGTDREEGRAGVGSGRGRGPGRGRGRGREGTGRGRGGKGSSRGRGTHLPRPLKICTSDFQDVFHAKVAQAAKYKVYMPQSTASKYLKLKQQYFMCRDQYLRRQKKETKKHSNENQKQQAAVRDVNNNDDDHDEAGTTEIGKQLDELTLSDKQNVEAGGCSPSSREDDDESDGQDDEDDPFDNLVVIPDTKSPQAIYVCQGTNLKMFVGEGSSGIECEQKLAREIFGPAYDPKTNNTQDKVGGSTKKGSSNVMPFKVSCAQCLLTRHYPNGFVAIMDPSNEKLQPVLQNARMSAAKKKELNQFHSDHSHFVTSLQISALYKFLETNKTRNKNREISNDIWKQLSMDGVVEDLLVVGQEEEIDTNTSRDDDDDNDNNNVQGMVPEIKLGHHLQALLYNVSKERHHEYVVVLGYNDSTTEIELDLPGGKRHLGETSVEGAIRETEEEISFKIDAEWFRNRIPAKYGGTLCSSTDDDDNNNKTNEKGNKSPWSSQILALCSKRKDEQGNVYFVMPPPPL